jgi:hypothetical protein
LASRDGGERCDPAVKVWNARVPFGARRDVVLGAERAGAA